MASTEESLLIINEVVWAIHLQLASVTQPPVPPKPNQVQEVSDFLQKPLVSVTTITETKEKQKQKSHSFPAGYCTSYIAQQTYVPWSGNAKDWLVNAKEYGFETGYTPQIGAIVVTSESYYGHVSLVEDIKGDKITVSEQNYLAFGVVSRRTIGSSSKFIRGYIYT